MKRRVWRVASVCCLALTAGLAVSGCSGNSAPSETVLRGRTMGTVWLLRIAGVAPAEAEARGLPEAVRRRLSELNGRLSMFEAGSDVERFNRAPAGEPVAVDSETTAVLRKALQLARLTDGAYDPTVGPLVDLWGFGPSGRRKGAPSGQEMDEARAVVGYRYVRSPDEHTVLKARPGLQLDFSSLAKGYAADELLELCGGFGWTNVLVEIGGDTVFRGRRPNGMRWGIGLQRPAYEARSGLDLLGTLSPPDGAVATSGDYRNLFRDEQGRLYAHIIDPRTARPVGHAVASVTVYAPACILADALATALYVLGPDEGLALLERHYPRAEALFILRRDDGWEQIASPGFEQATGYRQAVTAPR